MPLSLLYRLLIAVALVLCASSGGAQVGGSTPWQPVTTSDGSLATARHEASAVEVDGKLYLLGGRGNRPVEIYDPKRRRWQTSTNAPLELHHFQPVAVGRKIYALAAFTCCYPNEPSVADIYVFDTETETWSKAGKMPTNRVRGAAAAVVWEGMIYVLGGNTLGHNGGAVDWFDRYDPDTGDWDVLPDAPHARDHFAAAVVNGKLVAAGGRTTEQPNPFANPVMPTDVYDFGDESWRSRADIPTARAGTVSAASGDEVLVAGGEINTRSDAYRVTEAFNVNTNQWRALQPMNTARHSGGAAVVDGIWHIVAGSDVRGGSGEVNDHETLDLGEPVDQDGDGLTDSAETSEHNTDPLKADTDDDGLDDGDELELDTDPLDSDTDADLLSDGDEVNEHGTNPLSNDSDDDGLQDYAELMTVKSDPNDPDTDDDGLNDGDEVSLGTLPTVADTDLDGLLDGTEVDAGTDPLKQDTDDDGLNDDVDPDPLVPEENDPETPPEEEPVTQKKKGGAGMWLVLLVGAVGLSRMAVTSVKNSSI